MKKKLLAVAVAGVLAAPVVAFAQTTVTMTGKVHSSYASYRIGASTAAGKHSQDEVKDESSAVRFLIREDLGGGLAAVGKFDLRMATDLGTAANSGESFVGLTSKQWGSIYLGRTDLHYGKHGSQTGAYGSLFTNPVAVFDRAAAGTVTIANMTRTENVAWYQSPRFGGMFQINVAYSTQQTAAEADLKATQPKGRAWNLNPVLSGKNWQAEYSNWSSRGVGGANAGAAVTGTGAATTASAAAGSYKHRGDSLMGAYTWGGLRVALATNRSKTTSFAGVETSDRRTWGVPVSYQWGGKNNVFVDIYRAGGDKAAAFAGTDTRARFLGVTYAYDLSKRTSIAVSHTRINNGAAAAYNLFSASAAANLAVGEDPRATAISLNHRF